MDSNNDVLTDFKPFFSVYTLPHTSVGLTSYISIVFFSLKEIDPYDPSAACWFPLTLPNPGVAEGFSCMRGRCPLSTTSPSTNDSILTCSSQCQGNSSCLGSTMNMSGQRNMLCTHHLRTCGPADLDQITLNAFYCQKGKIVFLQVSLINFTWFYSSKQCLYFQTIFTKIN